MSGHDATWNALQRLRATRDELRREIPTEPDHAIQHHRADELLRQLVEEVIYETPREDEA